MTFRPLPRVSRAAATALVGAGLLAALLAAPLGLGSATPGPSQAPFGPARSAVSRTGVVAAGSEEAADAGARILEAGGNAADAAVAAAFALAVTYPQAGNLAGGGFLVARTAQGETLALDFRETAPAAARREMFVDRSGSPVAGASTLSGLAVGVPGTVRGLEALHRRLGKLPWAAVVEPSIRLARDGFRVPAKLSKDIADERKALSAHEASRALFLPGGEPLRPGSLLRQPELARTLALIAEKGADGFHKGTVAEQIASFVRRTGGVLTPEDLAAYAPVWRPPVVVEYGRWRIVTMPPPSSGGFLVSSILGQLAARGVLAPDLASPADVHLLLEAERRAYADRNRWLGDPAYVDVPIAKLLAPARLASLASSIDPERATPSSSVKADLEPGGSAGTARKRESEETTHLSVATADGAAVALTYTLNLAFGNGAVVPGVGALLNNEMDDFATAPGRPNAFDLVQGESNAVRPGARPLSSMTPLLAFEDGRLALVLGAPGGSTIPTTVLQTFLRAGPSHGALDAAVAAPRLHQQHLPDVVFVERGGGPPEAVLEGLTRRGHVLRERVPIGVVHAVALRSDGTLLGAADPRSSGAAAGAGAPGGPKPAASPR